MVSNKKLLAWTPLLTAMQKSISEEFGVRIRVFSPESRIKAAFYSLRKEYSPSFDSLSLLATSTPQEYLIYHPSLKGKEDGEREN